VLKNCFWGEDLQGVQTSPIKLNNQNKLVYSPHCYGPSVAYQPYFQDPTFPDNMPPIWDAHFGLVSQWSGQAVVIGEWGGLYDGQDQIWMDAFTDYQQERKLLQFFWCLNPDSGDTGGLLDNDWITPIQPKLDLLTRLIPQPSKITSSNGQVCIANP